MLKYCDGSIGRSLVKKKHVIMSYYVTRKVTIMKYLHCFGIFSRVPSSGGGATTICVTT